MERSQISQCNNCADADKKIIIKKMPAQNNFTIFSFNYLAGEFYFFY
jgi:hypothetical protein